MTFRRLPPPRDLDPFEQPVSETDPEAHGALPYRPGLWPQVPPKPFNLEHYRNWRRADPGHPQQITGTIPGEEE